MRIISLAENTSCRKDLGAEHGLSLYIETLNHKLLFDMGQTGLFAENARKLDVDLAAVNIAILSHGHYDHGGGLETFLKINRKAPVYLSRHAFEAHYNGTEKYIGLDVKLQAHPRLIFTEDVTPICKGLTLYSCNEKNMTCPPVQKNGKTVGKNRDSPAPKRSFSRNIRDKVGKKG